MRGIQVFFALSAGACRTVVDGSAEVVEQERDGVWVFTYASTPSYTSDALAGGPAAVVDGCLQMGDAVVIWHDQHLAAVDDVIARVAAGEALTLTVGGGGRSLEEGSTVDDFPIEVVERCPAAREIWFSAGAALVVEAGS